MAYWAGRFSTLRDRLKREDSHLGSNNIVRLSDSSGASRSSKEYESYDMAERRRTKMVLQELRSSCQTDAALRSFEDFEERILKQLYNCSDPNALRSRSSLSSSGPKPKSDLMPRNVWRFGQSHGHSRNVSNTTSLTSQLPTLSRPGLLKSKTVGNLASLGDRPVHSTRARASTPPNLSANAMGGQEPTAWKRPAYLEAQVKAKYIRGQRVLAKAEATRKASANVDDRVTAAMGTESSGDGIAQGWHGDEPSVAAMDGSRKSSGAESLRSLMNGMRKMRRNFTGSMDGHE